MKHFYTFALLCLPFIISAQTAITSSITPDLAAYGETTNFPGQGEYEIFLSADGILDKPIVVVDPFDPGDTLNIAALYNLFNFTNSSGDQNLIDLIRAEGFDVIFLNFPNYTRAEDNAIIDGGTDYLERNAMVLVELINTINAEKASNNADQNVIIGPSAGGLIARYALNYMESESLDADTRLYISFDSPHFGANIPIGLQHQLNFLANNSLSPVTELAPLIDGTIKSPAARQMLIDHFEAHLSGADLYSFDSDITQPTPHPYRNIFEASLNSLTPTGFPENVRNVAIINGSTIGSSYTAADGVTPVTNGFTMVDLTLPMEVPIVGAIDIEIEINMTPSAGTPQQVSRFFAPLFPPFIPNVESIANSGTSFYDGVDAAPGGLIDFSALMDQSGTGGDMASDFIDGLQIDKFSFIPSISALALDTTDESTGNERNWFHDIEIDGSGHAINSPFDNTFSPIDNQPHLYLSDANVAFALNEILNAPLSTTNSEFLSMKLENNPIKNELVILNTENIKAKINIMDLTGKTVYQLNSNLNNRTSIPINLSSGFYILKVVSDTNATFTTKFMVNN